MTSYRELARNRSFTLLWTAQAGSQLGTSVAQFTFPLVGYALTHSVLLAGLGEVAVLAGLVGTLLPAGVLADRHDRRTLMLWANVAGVLAASSLAVTAALGVLTLAQLLVAGLVLGASAGLYEPAESAAVRDVVDRDDLPTALSQNQARGAVSGLVGGPVGGALYAVSRAIPFVADAVSYLLALLLVRRLHPLPAPRAERPASTFRADVAEGLSYIWRHPIFRTLTIWSSMTNLLVNAALYVATLRMVQAGVHPAAIGVVDTCAGLGGILGALAAPWIIDRVPTGRLTVAIAWVWAPVVLPMAFSASPWVIGPLLFAGMLTNPAGNAAMGSYRAATTPAAIMARAGAASMVCGMSMLPLAPLVGGVALSIWGGRGATYLIAGLSAVIAILPTANRALRAIPRPASWPRDDETARLGNDLVSYQ